MSFKAKTVYEAKIGEKLFQFLCDGDSSVDHVISILEIILKDAKDLKVQLEKQQAEKEAQPKEE